MIYEQNIIKSIKLNKYMTVPGFIGAQRKIEFNYILRTKSSLMEGEDRPKFHV
jgi:hypothetical protein